MSQKLRLKEGFDLSLSFRVDKFRSEFWREIARSNFSVGKEHKFRSRERACIERRVYRWQVF